MNASPPQRGARYPVRLLTCLFSLRSWRLCVESARPNYLGPSCAASSQGRLRLGFARSGDKTQSREERRDPVQVTFGARDLGSVSTFLVGNGARNLQPATVLQSVLEVRFTSASGLSAASAKERRGDGLA